MAVKNLQYLMGHSDVGATLNIYTHSRYEDAAKEMLNINAIDTNTEQKKCKLANGEFLLHHFYTKNLINT